MTNDQLKTLTKKIANNKFCDATYLFIIRLMVIFFISIVL